MEPARATQRKWKLLASIDVGCWVGEPSQPVSVSLIVSHQVLAFSGCGPCVCKAANEKVENADALAAN